MSDDGVVRIASAVEAVRIHGLRSFSWFNRDEPVLDPAVARRVSLAMQRDHFREALAARLYASFYCLGFATPSQHEPLHPRLLSSKDIFGRELATANSGLGYPDAGWAVLAASSREVVVHKSGLALRVRRRDCLPGGALPPGPDARLGIRMAKDSRTLSPGYYVALSDEPFVENDPLIRLYWNLDAGGAIALMRAATAALNQARLPFRLKAVDHPSRFTRCDAVVLYASKADFSSIREVLKRVYPTVASRLQDGVPAFTKPIAPGLGLAEDPPSRGSFGLHRCRILAEGILEADERRQRRLNPRLETVGRRFDADGISLRRPYLNPGSADDYVFDVPCCGARPAPSARLLPSRATDPRQSVRATAVEIGRLLTQRAIWSTGRCNWMGLDAHGVAGALESSGPLAYKALGPTLFAGTSGIAWFLAELAASASDPAVRRTAVGAMDQALSRAPALRAAGRMGLYDGVTGIGVAAAYVGALLGEDRLCGAARELARAFLPENLSSVEPDLISGLAGVIVGLLTLHALWREESLLNAATRCGDALLASACRQAGLVSWRSVGFPRQRPLTGYSHGSAGIACALLELFRAGGAARFREAAESAFDYERQWFDGDRENWPDFRGVSAKGSPLNHAFSFPVAWCHGAGGIALSRLRAYRLLEDARYCVEALIALRTTLSWTAGALERRSEVGNFALCHGLAGNAAVLAQGARVLGAEFAAGGALAEEAAMACVASGVEPARWRFGALGDGSPSLMLGLAGVGHFCLALSDPATPSPLLLEPEAIVRRLGCEAQTGAPAA